MSAAFKFAAFCLFLWHGSFDAVVGGVDSASGRTKALKARFLPGPLGIEATWSSGLINSVPADGQGSVKGVQAGWYIEKVEGKSYSEERLDGFIAGNKEYNIIFSKLEDKTPKEIPRRDESVIPPKPDFKYATELTPATFTEKISDVVNASEGFSHPAYYPVVMFYVSWCSHCKHALPEFEDAAKIVADSAREGRLAHYGAVPKFFLIECDINADYTAFCAEFVQGSFPVIALFRDRRVLKFNRPRLAGTFAWWAQHVSRSPVTEVTEKSHLSQFEQQGPVFILSAEIGNAKVVESWYQVALDFIEDHNLVFIQPGAAAARGLPAAPSISVRSEGLEPLPFKGVMNKTTLFDWVNINQFPPVTQLTPFSGHDMRKSGRIVVALSYDATSAAGKQVRAAFDNKAKKLRRSGRYLFAAIDVGNPEQADWIGYAFPLLSPGISPPPRVFAFQGDSAYWEDPKLSFAAADITHESIVALLAASAARQDDSYLEWAKERRTYYFRYASSSIVGFILAVALPLALILCCWKCIKEVYNPDEYTWDGDEKSDADADMKLEKVD